MEFCPESQCGTGMTRSDITRDVEEIASEGYDMIQELLVRAQNEYMRRLIRNIWDASGKS